MIVGRARAGLDGAGRGRPRARRRRRPTRRRGGSCRRLDAAALGRRRRSAGPRALVAAQRPVARRRRGRSRAPPAARALAAGARRVRAHAVEAQQRVLGGDVAARGGQRRVGDATATARGAGPRGRRSAARRRRCARWRRPRRPGARPRSRARRRSRRASGWCGPCRRRPAARGARELEERQDRAGRAALVAVVQVVDVGLVEVDGLLDQPQAEHARVEVDVARRVRGDRGDVVQAFECHDARFSSSARRPRNCDGSCACNDITIVVQSTSRSRHAVALLTSFTLKCSRAMATTHLTALTDPRSSTARAARLARHAAHPRALTKASTPSSRPRTASRSPPTRCSCTSPTPRTSGCACATSPRRSC